MSSMYGISAYQQASGAWNTQKNTKTESTSTTSASTKTSTNTKSEGVRTTDFKPLNTSGPLVPTQKSGVGLAIGDVQLSDEAQKYYEKLKSKFHNMEFIAVSKDIKSQVQANVSAYGNANRQVVLIDDEKIEKMATDENFRKKYEGIIQMSQLKLQEAKNSLSSSGANVKNFGMSVDANGNTSFFATIEKTAEANKKVSEKAAEKKAAAKKEAKLKEKKVAEKKSAEKKAEAKAEKAELEEKRAEAAAEEDALEVSNESIDDKDYVNIKAPTMQALFNQVSKYAYDKSASSVMTDSEKQVGQSFDAKF